MVPLTRPEFGVHNLIGLAEVLEASVRGYYFVQYIQDPLKNVVRTIEHYDHVPDEAKSLLTGWNDSIARIESQLNWLLIELGHKLNLSVVANLPPTPNEILTADGVETVCSSHYVFSDLTKDANRLANLFEWMTTTLAEIDREFDVWLKRSWYDASEEEHDSLAELRCRASESRRGLETLQQKVEELFERLSAMTLQSGGL